MPDVLLVEQIQLDWTDIENRCTHPVMDTQKRASGVHLSGIIRKVAIATGRLRVGQAREEQMPTRMAMGMAWENWVVGLYPDLIWQPGEMTLDGISGNPDGYSPLEDNDTMALDEFKLTWKGRKDDILDDANWMWMAQMSGYCKMLGITHAKLHVCYVNNQYKPPEPVYYRYLIEWTQREIDEAWAMMIANKEGVEEE